MSEASTSVNTSLRVRVWARIDTEIETELVTEESEDAAALELESYPSHSTSENITYRDPTIDELYIGLASVNANLDIARRKVLEHSPETKRRSIREFGFVVGGFLAACSLTTFVNPEPHPSYRERAVAAGLAAGDAIALGGLVISKIARVNESTYNIWQGVEAESIELQKIINDQIAVTEGLE